MKDLVILTPDKNTQYAITGALGRCESLGIRRVEFELRVHAGRDGGVRKSGADVLALERRRFRHALVLLDFEGSGTSLAGSAELESELDERLRPTWGPHAKAIVIDPEVDIWVWGADNAIEPEIGWREGRHVREWLRRNGFELDENSKPIRPKEALEAALRFTGLPRSSALYLRVARRISLARCTDAAFGRLTARLREWFPA
ncbi:MAG: hypothetical protein H7A46_22250 [Verrucomicrobiales bacterium]|nr:hypothetical protein [Verrucomicrobiales bacterium]